MLPLDFKKMGGLIPAVIQDAQTRRVLTVGFMNETAYQKTLDTGLVTFWSRTRNTLWTKGETSGHLLRVLRITPDCDNDTLLVEAEPVGPTCHTGADTCFNQPNTAPTGSFLAVLEAQLRDRKHNPKPDSHTSMMFTAGLNKITQKFGEEAIELVIEAKDHNDDRFKNEAADLLYRFICLLVEKDISLQSVIEVLEARHKS